MFLWKKSWLFGLFSEDKGDYSDLWMIKIKIKANETEIELCFLHKNITYKNHVCPHSLAFSLSLLVREFKSYRETWHQNL